MVDSALLQYGHEVQNFVVFVLSYMNLLSLDSVSQIQHMSVSLLRDKVICPLLLLLFLDQYVLHHRFWDDLLLLYHYQLAWLYLRLQQFLPQCRHQDIHLLPAFELLIQIISLLILWIMAYQVVTLQLKDFYFYYWSCYGIRSLFLDFTHASLDGGVAVASSINSSSVNLFKEDWSIEELPLLFQTQACLVLRKLKYYQAI